MNEAPFIEKRAFPRFSVNIPLCYSQINSDEQIPGHTLDISAQGLGLVTAEALSPGMQLEIRLQMHDNQEEILRRGRVVWSSSFGNDKYRAGIKLDEPDLKPIPLVLRTIYNQKKH
jgi:c-di-GMP-binding flagellar brake protein YcgR